MNIPPRNMDIVTDKMCGFLTNIAENRPRHDFTFSSALRLMLIDPKCYEKLPTYVADGLLINGTYNTVQ